MSSGKGLSYKPSGSLGSSSELLPGRGAGVHLQQRHQAGLTPERPTPPWGSHGHTPGAGPQNVFEFYFKKV